jgi:hypothetical protein
MDTIRKALNKIKSIYLYSDSEPNELLISFVHMLALPATICFDMNNPVLYLVFGSIFVGAYQFYAVICGCLSKRLRASKLAVLVAVITVVNLFMMGLLNGSRVGWVIIMLFAGWNLVRVQQEKHYREIKK